MKEINKNSDHNKKLNIINDALNAYSYEEEE